MNKLPKRITDEEWLKTPRISKAVQLLANKINEILDFLDEQFKEKEGKCKYCDTLLYGRNEEDCAQNPAPQEKCCIVCNQKVSIIGNPHCLYNWDCKCHTHVSQLELEKRRKHKYNL